LETSLRTVSRKDWDFLLRVRNKKEYRSFFLNKHTITKKEHYTYMKKQESNPEFFIWIIAYKGKDAGYVRILGNDIGIIIKKNYHGKGIGSDALKLLESKAKKLGIKKLVGRVLIHNKISKKLFVKNNYNLKMYWYEKDIR